MSTFATFTTVRLGIYSAQKGLDIAGNNIANINTPGYTRQRLDQVSLVANAGADRTASKYNSDAGQGVLITGISQLRDPSLDISYRNSVSDVSSAQSKLEGLDRLASILDEVGKGDGEQDDGVILNQMNDLRDLISQAITNGIDDYDSLIRTSADALCSLFNTSAKALENLKSEYETKFNDQVKEVNDILDSIKEMNLQIRNSDIRGDPALELRDERNKLIDELSQYMKIDVTYDMEDVGAGLEVERLTIKLATGDKNTLVVDGTYATELVGGTEEDGYSVSLNPLTDSKGRYLDPNANANTPPTLLGDNDLYGSLQSVREMLTESGEYSTLGDMDNDPQANIKRGIPYYQQALDHLAFEFAEQMNALNQIQYKTDANDNPIRDADGNFVLEEGSGPLFSMGSNTDNTETYTKVPNSNPEEWVVTGHITAANISVSKSWKDGSVSMVAQETPDSPSGDTGNLVKFLDVFNKEHTFTYQDMVLQPIYQDQNGDYVDLDGNPVDPNEFTISGDTKPFEGSFEDMLFHIQATLGEDQLSTGIVHNNYTITNNELYVSRDGVTGVDLNDEATSLMVYQKAYSSACRLMTVINETLDSLINMG